MCGWYSKYIIKEEKGEKKKTREGRRKEGRRGEGEWRKEGRKTDPFCLWVKRSKAHHIKTCAPSLLNLVSTCHCRNASNMLFNSAHFKTICSLFSPVPPTPPSEAKWNPAETKSDKFSSLHGLFSFSPRRLQAVRNVTACLLWSRLWPVNTLSAQTRSRSG